MNEPLPSRVDAEQRAGRIPKPGGAKPAKWGFVHGTTEVLVKDVRYTHPLFRYTMGRYLLRREARHYRWLEGVSFIPRCFGMLDADALVVEKVDAASLGQIKKRETPAGVPEQLRRCLGELHARGFVHLDLRTRRNTLVTRDGRVLVIDFAHSLYLGNRPVLRRLLMPILAPVDRSAVLKIVARSFPEQMTESEQRRYRRFQMLRKLWPFTALWRFLNPHVRNRPHPPASGQT